MTTGKTIALTKWTLVGKVVTLLFNTLSRFFIAFLPRNMCFWIPWLQTLSAVILENKKIKICHCYHFFPFYLPWSDGTVCHDLNFTDVGFQASFFTLLFHRHQEAFDNSSSLPPAIRVVSSAYLRFLVFLPTILISGCDSLSPAFPVMDSA